MIVFIYPIHDFQTNSYLGYNNFNLWWSRLLRNEKGSLVMSLISYFGNMINRDKFSHCCYMEECILFHGISVWQ